MMYARVDGDDQRQLARPGQHGRCPGCDQPVLAKCGEIRIWHWAHEPDRECDPWAEGESEWHLSWKRHAPADRTEVVIERDNAKHRADVLCLNGAILELQASSIAPSEIRDREGFYKHMAWLFRVTWADRLHYGKRGFWWKYGHLAQTLITKPLFWDFEDEDIIQEVKLGKAEDSGRVLGRAVKTYARAQFAGFIATGKMS